MTSLAPDEFRSETIYLNTASHGLPPRRSLAAVAEVTERWAAGRGAPMSSDHLVPEFRAACARLLAGAHADHLAIGGGAATLIGPVAAALAPGAEVLVAKGEFASVTMPFVHRGDLVVRAVPLEKLAAEVRPGTDLVAVSVVQSADGRVTDLAPLRAATEAAGARLLVDATQAAGWLPLRFADADYWVCATFKWLLGARSVAFFAAAPEAAAALRPLAPSWYAARDPWAELYDPIALPDTARRFDATPDWLGVVAAHAALELLEELGIDRVHAHNLRLANQFRTGLRDLGFDPVPGDSAIVAVPGAGDLAPRLDAAGVVASARAGGLRFAFHLHNDDADVDRALNALAG
ncbi:aminotransferase class V-fold PLP-dependent enzyme [Nocardia puris]|uniref:Selenocysteine lyase/cysteine desulfurase n=1 Tax=Nocardia puris TaxID=208602 RepID=A0A366DUI3_9NOCA|nr:aminotransferase class V-fold PLP-dependent enzyme [Nocardia puris]MBF6210327.1 aminotransferase class V-fold PLP-dependent enzyme [Nocardia puris]MBF6367402.1 aminotransferase class V-fold PLP-dependent enzyme [Nocardia puris]MBF6457587.1 aminotransferase class V-fold PLP-dependent enzyme [Nocardia puris]RBO93750.1 selenocysteine lyase/cysteine desulfurase [Nocardia puris]